MKIAKSRKLTDGQKLVSHLIKTTKCWGKEIKIAKVLLAVHPLEFWLSLTGDFFSLTYFLTPEGKNFVAKKFLEFKLEIKPQESYVIGTEKMGEDRKFEKKPRNAFEFVREENL